MNADKALESRMLPIERVCNLFVYSLFFNINTHPVFPLRRLDRKSEPCEGKTRLLMSSYTYLALGISNPVGTKISRWRLRINSFCANGYLRSVRSYTKV